MWIGFPKFESWLRGRHWMAYQEEIQSYKNHGLNYKDIINNYQKMSQSRIQANAIRSGASNIATALYLSRPMRRR